MEVIYHPEVEEIIKGLMEIDNSRVVKVVDLFKDYKFSLTQLFLKKVVKGLWELRAGRYRLLFGIMAGNAVVTRIFIKKTEKTPKKEIKLALRRLKEYEEIS